MYSNAPYDMRASTLQGWQSTTQTLERAAVPQHTQCTTNLRLQQTTLLLWQNEGDETSFYQVQSIQLKYYPFEMLLLLENERYYDSPLW